MYSSLLDVKSDQGFFVSIRLNLIIVVVTDILPP